MYQIQYSIHSSILDDFSETQYFLNVYFNSDVLIKICGSNSEEYQRQVD